MNCWAERRSALLSTTRTSFSYSLVSHDMATPMLDHCTRFTVHQFSIWYIRFELQCIAWLRMAQFNRSAESLGEIHRSHAVYDLFPFCCSGCSAGHQATWKWSDLCCIFFRTVWVVDESLGSSTKSRTALCAESSRMTLYWILSCIYFKKPSPITSIHCGTHFSSCP